MSIQFPQSCPARDAAAMARFEQLDAGLAALAAAAGAEAMQYPALISRQALSRAEYPKAFPHLLMAAAHLRSPELTGDDQLEPGNLASPGWCLSPAVCYHVYAGLAGQTLCQPRIITARGRCFRHEATIDAGRRQIEFEMREVVLLGPADWVAESASEFKEKLDSQMRGAQIEGRWQPAADPFFLPAARAQAIMQQLKETKIEYIVGADELAVSSVNRHGDFFGRRFDISDQKGRPIHTACIAAGLDRWATCAAVHSEQQEVIECHA